MYANKFRARGIFGNFTLLRADNKCAEPGSVPFCRGALIKSFDREGKSQVVILPKPDARLPNNHFEKHLNYLCLITFQ